MSNWLYQIRIKVSEKLSADLRGKKEFELSKKIIKIADDHCARLVCTFDAFAEYCEEAEKEGIEIANETDYGLVAGVWTNDGARQLRVAKAMNCGQVFINGYGSGGGIELPFGGVKKSGHGREKGFEALYEFCSTKTLVFNHK